MGAACRLPTSKFSGVLPVAKPGKARPRWWAFHISGRFPAARLRLRLGPPNVAAANVAPANAIKRPRD